MNYVFQMIIVALIIGAVCLLRKLLKRVKMRMGEMIYATVVAKQDSHTGWLGLKPRWHGAIRPVYRVTFEFGNRRSVQLQVPKKTYEGVSIGSRGVLVYDVTDFRAFHVDKKIPDIIKKAAKRKNGVTFEQWLKNSGG